MEQANASTGEARGAGSLVETGGVAVEELERLRRRVEHLESLYRLIDALSHANTVEAIYRAALDSLRDLVRAERAAVLVFDGDGVMRFKDWQRLSDAYRGAVEGHSAWSRDDATAEPVLVDDVSKEPSLAGFRDVIRAEGIGALGFVPLLAQGRLVGKLMIYYDGPHVFTDEEVRLAQVVASHVALAAERRHAELERDRSLEREQAARAEAEAASRTKDEFLATLSHELRTPLNAMMGWTQLLRRGKLGPEDTARALETIERNTNVQAQLIEDLLDVSRVIQGKLTLNIQLVRLETIVQAAIDSIRPAAEARGISVEQRLMLDTAAVAGDIDRLQQIFWNLLSNAIKFTPEGGTVRVTLQRVDPHVRVTVADNGAGIDPEFLPHVFERFRQGTQRTRGHGGLGLGLAIVRHLTELHGGTVTAHSDGRDRGATFTIRLPVAAVASVDHEPGHLSGTPWPSRPRPSLDGTLVLVVDDELDARELLGAVLRQSGAEVLTAASADEAMQQLDEHTPDVLVSDIGMPGEDGFGLIRRVRAREVGTGRRLPAVALTAYARPEDRARALIAGFQLHVPKPVEPLELVIVIASLVGRDYPLELLNAVVPPGIDGAPAV